MYRLIIRRIIRGFVALIVFQTLLFALIQALPYDYSVLFFGDSVLRNYIKTTLGLNRPYIIQYLDWMTGFFHLNLGKSFMAYPIPVTTILLNKAPRTLLLFFSGILIAYFLGIWLGKQIAWHHGSKFEIGATLGGVATYTSFAPWLGFLMLNVFSWHLGWFPFQKLIDPNKWWRVNIPADLILGFMVISGGLAFGAIALLWYFTRKLRHTLIRWAERATGCIIIGVTLWVWWAHSGFDYLAVDILSHLVLPLATVILLSFGETMLTMRTTMLETMNEEYVTTARAKGLSESVIRNHHVARNAFFPVLTRLLLNIPFVLVGSLAIEIVFRWDAMGQLIFNAIEYQDIPILMGALSFVGVMTLLAHIFLDIFHIFVDPRLRYTGEFS
ncbi:MAG TPA: ABC transporter permease [Anaerolineae bacterium]|nr:ABC transporter permease [Anaerolineae bacterium]